MITLRTLKDYDKFVHDSITYRKVQERRLKEIGVVNVQRVDTRVFSYLPLTIEVTPVTNAYTKRRVPLTAQNTSHSKR